MPKCMIIVSLQMCALAEKRTIDTLIDGGPQKSGDFDYSITQCKSFTSAGSHPTRYYALLTVILTIDNCLLEKKSHNVQETVSDNVYYIRQL